MSGETGISRIQSVSRNISSDESLNEVDKISYRKTHFKNNLTLGEKPSDFNKEMKRVQTADVMLIYFKKMSNSFLSSLSLGCEI